MRHIRTILVLLAVACWPIALAAGACSSTFTPVPEPVAQVDAGPPRERQGSDWNTSAAPAACSVGSSCQTEADPATGQPWVSVDNWPAGFGSDAGTVIVQPDGGFATATNQSLQIAQETASASSLAEIANTVESAGVSATTAQAVQGVSGGVPVPVVLAFDGGVPTTVQLTAAVNAVADQGATTTPTALAALASGPNGILVRSSPTNDPSCFIRIGTNAGNGVGSIFGTGDSFVFPVANASDLFIYLQSATDGGTCSVTAEQA